MENEFSRLVDALPGLVWSAVSDGHIDLPVDDGANATASALSYC